MAFNEAKNTIFLEGESQTLSKSSLAIFLYWHISNYSDNASTITHKICETNCSFHMK